MKIKIELVYSLNRPSWTQEDLFAFNHLHLFNKIKKDYFSRTECSTLGCFASYKGDKRGSDSRRENSR